MQTVSTRINTVEELEALYGAPSEASLIREVGGRARLDVVRTR